MQRVSEKEANALSGDAECPVIFKEESEPQEAAVCLKRLPTGFLLGASDKTGELQLWTFTDLEDAEDNYNRLTQIMRIHGTPLGGTGLD